MFTRLRPPIGRGGAGGGVGRRGGGGGGGSRGRLAERWGPLALLMFLVISFQAFSYWDGVNSPLKRGARRVIRRSDLEGDEGGKEKHVAAGSSPDRASGRDGDQEKAGGSSPSEDKHFKVAASHEGAAMDEPRQGKPDDDIPQVEEDGKEEDVDESLTMEKSAYVRGLSAPDREFLRKWGVNLRGLKCELRMEGGSDAKEEDKVERVRCYTEDEQGRELCPPHVDPVWLTRGENQYACLVENSGQYYCHVRCQEESAQVGWLAFEREWCKTNDCDKEDPVIPLNEFELKPWTGMEKRPLDCPPESEREKSLDRALPRITLGILANRETNTLRATMQTYAKAGLLDAAGEILIYLNSRDSEMEDMLKPFVNDHNIKVMGDEANHGILNAINWMLGNSSNDHFLLLEKDFRLTESMDCVVEQLGTGLKLIEEGTAHVVKFRSRRFPGKPHWAARMYMDKEDDVFQRQPNLLCNFYHWIEHPEERWPQHFRVCHEEPRFYCVTSEFCNWTNNPVLFDRRWWTREYLTKFKDFKNYNPYKDIELYMNWEENAWNNRGWIIAEGDGVFKHVDLRYVI